MATTFWPPVFSEFWISFFLIKNHYFLKYILHFFDPLRVNLLILITSWSILAGFEGFGKFKKSKMVDPRWLPFKNKALLWRHMTSSVYDVDLNGNVFGRTVCPLSLVAIALIFSEFRGGGGIRRPWSHKTKKSPVWIGLNYKLHTRKKQSELKINLTRVLSKGPFDLNLPFNFIKINK